MAEERNQSSPWRAVDKKAPETDSKPSGSRPSGEDAARSDSSPAERPAVARNLRVVDGGQHAASTPQPRQNTSAKDAEIVVTEFEDGTPARPASRPTTTSRTGGLKPVRPDNGANTGNPNPTPPQEQTPQTPTGTTGRPAMKPVLPDTAAPQKTGASTVQPQARPAQTAPQAGASTGATTPPTQAVQGNAQGQARGQAQAQGNAQPLRDDLRRIIIRLSRDLGKPVGMPEIEAAAPGVINPQTIDHFKIIATRLNYHLTWNNLTERKPDRIPTPFVVFPEKEGGAHYIVIRPEGSRFLVYEPRSNATKTLPAEEVATLGDRTASIKLMPDVVRMERNWRSMVARQMRGVLIELATASLFINILALAAPLFIMTVFNKVVGQNAEATLISLAIGMVVIYVFDLFLRTIRVYVSSFTGARIESLVGGELVHHLLRLPYRHFEETASGVIAERMRQLDTIRGFFTGQMPMVVADLLFVGVFLAALFLIQWKVGLLVLAAVPVFIAMSIFSHRRQKKYTEQNFLGQAAKASALHETMANALTIKAMGLETEVERRWDQRLGLSAWTGFRANLLSGILSVVGQVLQQVLSLLVIVMGAVLIMQGEMSVGALIATNILASRAVAPMRQVVSAWNQVHEVRAAFRRIDDIMTEAPEGEPGDIAPGSRMNGSVKFENVSYRYAEDAPSILNNVNLDIKAGEVFGIIGPSGQGKTTIAKLIQSLYIPDHGRILVDSTDISHISTNSLRKQIGVVPQDVQLFAGTVRENIAMGTEDKNPARVEAVARFVGAHDFIQRLPKGYDTILSERGGGLSAGQRQLLSVARALIRNPQILILDEATSALDAGAEERLIRSLKQVKQGRTVIMISHRMAPMAIADRVALLLDGNIERVGPPQEVISYARARMKNVAMASARTPGAADTGKPADKGAPKGTPDQKGTA